MGVDGAADDIAGLVPHGFPQGGLVGRRDPDGEIGGIVEAGKVEGQAVGNPVVKPEKAMGMPRQLADQLAGDLNATSDDVARAPVGRPDHRAENMAQARLAERDETMPILRPTVV